MKMAVRVLARFWRETEGATAVEYGLIAAVMATAIVAGGAAIGTEVRQMFCLVAAGFGAAC